MALHGLGTSDSWTVGPGVRKVDVLAAKASAWGFSMDVDVAHLQLSKQDIRV